MKHQLYVLACPRSGTTHTARVLQAAGHQIKHESPGPEGMVGWNAIYRRIPGDALVLHQVRHPLNCITSMQTMMDRNFTRLMNSIAIDGDSVTPERRVEICARLWVYFNAQIEPMAIARFRVESDAEWSAALQRAGMPPVDRSGTSATANTRKHIERHQRFYARPVTWEQIRDSAGRQIDLAIRRMAIRYGYDA